MATVQSTAFDIGSRQGLKDAMQRKVSEEALSRMDPGVLESLLTQAQGGSFGSARSLGKLNPNNDVVSKNNPGGAMVARWDAEAAQRQEWKRQDELTAQKQSQADKEYYREHPVVPKEEEDRLRRQQLFEDTDKFTSSLLASNAVRDARYTGEGTGSPYEAAALQRVATGGGGGRVVVGGGGSAPRTLPGSRVALDKERDKRLSLVKDLRAHISGLESVGEGERTSQQAADLATKRLLLKDAENNLEVSSTGTDVEQKKPAVKGRISYGMGVGGTDLLTNIPEADLMAAMAQKFGAEGNQMTGAEAYDAARRRSPNTMFPSRELPNASPDQAAGTEPTGEDPLTRARRQVLEHRNTLGGRGAK